MADLTPDAAEADEELEGGPFLTATQWQAMVAATEALVHQTEAAAMQARSLQAQVAAFGGALEGPPAAPVGLGSPISAADLAQVQRILGKQHKTPSYFGRRPEPTVEPEDARDGTREQGDQSGGGQPRRARKGGGQRSGTPG